MEQHYNENQEDINPEVEILKNALDFSKTKVRDCMIPRTEVISMDVKEDISSLKTSFFESGHSKIIIYKENIDFILGYVHSYELFKKPEKIRDMLLPISFVPESMLVKKVLDQLLKGRRSIAVVLDEYGGTSGIVTLEDVLEEIVGEINDEFDDDGERYSRIDDHTFIFEAKTSLNDFLKIVGGDFDYFDNIKGDADTIAGLILEKTRVLPEVQNHVEIFPYQFIIESVDDRKINRVKVIVKKWKDLYSLFYLFVLVL